MRRRNLFQVDIPTFVGFLRDLENDYEVEDYARMYFGTGKGVLQFAQKFVEMRKKFKNGAPGGGGVAGQKKGNKKNRKNKNKANPDLLGKQTNKNSIELIQIAKKSLKFQKKTQIF